MLNQHELARNVVPERVHFVHSEAGERMLEQHHILRFAEGRITGIDQLCTGLHVP